MRQLPRPPRPALCLRHVRMASRSVEYGSLAYYGTAPDDLATLATVEAPVLGLYGGNDARVDATIEATQAAMRTHGKSYEPHVFEGAGHGFLRAQDGQDGANLRAAEQAWPMTLSFLRQHLQ